MLLLLGLLLLGGLLRGLSLLRFLRHAALLAVSWLAMSQQCNRESTALTLFIYSTAKKTANLLNEKWTYAKRVRPVARSEARDADEFRRAPQSRSEEFANNSPHSQKPAWILHFLHVAIFARAPRTRACARSIPASRGVSHALREGSDVLENFFWIIALRHVRETLNRARSRTNQQK
jgi:hypothetical protein